MMDGGGEDFYAGDGDEGSISLSLPLGQPIFDKK
jgi:hypothetical protein